MQKNLLLREFEDLKRAIILLKESIKKFNPYKTEKNILLTNWNITIHYLLDLRKA